jgi:hypothetical protein
MRGMSARSGICTLWTPWSGWRRIIVCLVFLRSSFRKGAEMEKAEYSVAAATTPDSGSAKEKVENGTQLDADEFRLAQMGMWPLSCVEDGSGT